VSTMRRMPRRRPGVPASPAGRRPPIRAKRFRCAPTASACTDTPRRWSWRQSRARRPGPFLASGARAPRRLRTDGDCASEDAARKASSPRQRSSITVPPVHLDGWRA
jgi:hypothetical protein